MSERGITGVAEVILDFLRASPASARSIVRAAERKATAEELAGLRRLADGEEIELAVAERLCAKGLAVLDGGRYLPTDLGGLVVEAALVLEKAGG